MQRWNGWGDADIELPLQPAALAFLQQTLGPGTPMADASLQSCCEQLPASRLTGSRLNCDPAARLQHSHGQSLPDWLRLRHGVIGPVTDAVVTVQTEAELRDALQQARQHDARVIPFGGGTSVVGHLQPAAGDRPSVTLNLQRHCRLRQLRDVDRLALFDAGVSGPLLEAQLRAHGYTLGHFPQSFEFSTLGGWIATRSSGQQSRRYGRIEQLFAGGRVLQDEDDLDLPPFPASAAGPDLRELVLGSEGRLGVISQAWVRIRPLPAHEQFNAVFFPDWANAVQAARQLAQSDLTFSMLRLSNAAETRTLLLQAGHVNPIRWLERYLRWRDCAENKCLMLIGFSGNAHACRQQEAEALALCRRHGGINTGRPIGEAWRKNRFRNVYLRNTLWQHGYAVDTVETACTWQQTSAMVHAVEQAAHNALLPWGERVHAYTHLSHVYSSGSSVYSTFMYRLSQDYEQNLARWRQLKHAVSDAIAGQGGTISHQHGVGVDHQHWLAREKSAAGMQLLRATIAAADPAQRFDNGNLLSSADQPRS